MVSELILPDSRLSRRPDLGSVMMDWPMPDGRVLRIEAVPVYCASCGKKYGLVPRENTTFCCYLCNQCFEQYGAIVATYALPDDEFCRAVAYEMERTYGRTLTEMELVRLADEGRLTPALLALERDSPFPAVNNRPKG